MSDWTIIVICGAYIFLEAFLAYLGHKFLSLKGEVIRKFIHIATSFLVFPVVYGISNPSLRLLGPGVFVVLNALMTYSGMGKYIGLNDEKRHLGLIVYPLSLIILILLMNKGLLSPSSVASGVMIMGLGDGMAALIGTKWGRHKYKVKYVGTKSAEGTLAMFLFSFLVSLLFSPVSIPSAFILALIATALENLSPSGLDNATVPIFSALILEALCRL